MARGSRVAGAAREEREEARLLLRVDMVLLDWIDLLLLVVFALLVSYKWQLEIFFN